MSKKFITHKNALSKMPNPLYPLACGSDRCKDCNSCIEGYCSTLHKSVNIDMRRSCKNFKLITKSKRKKVDKESKEIDKFIEELEDTDSSNVVASF